MLCISESWLEITASGVDDVGPMYPPAVGRAVCETMKLDVYLIKMDLSKDKIRKPILLGSCKFSESSKGVISIAASKLFEYNFSNLMFKVTSDSCNNAVVTSSHSLKTKRPASSFSTKQRKRQKTNNIVDSDTIVLLEESLVANMALYDSRHKCLLDSGEYSLLLHRDGMLSKYEGSGGTLNWKTIFGMTDKVCLYQVPM